VDFAGEKHHITWRKQLCFPHLTKNFYYPMLGKMSFEILLANSNLKRKQSKKKENREK